MKGNRKKLLIIVIAVFILAGGAFSSYRTSHNSGEVAVKKKEEVSNKQEINKDLEVKEESDHQEVEEGSNRSKVGIEVQRLHNILKEDIVLGDRNAPVTMIEYASLSCPHCANFYKESFDKFKELYIDTGKVKFVYRDFPLNKPALAASVISLCYAQDNDNSPERYHSFIKALFKIQDSWAFSPQFIEKLRSISKLSGMNNKRFEECLNDVELRKTVIENRQNASNLLKIQSTPTFIINGYSMSGFKDLQSLREIIEKAL